MREILFRGKRIDTGEWVYGMPCATELSGIYSIQTLQGGIFDIFPETVGQYTGLTDKNGKRIFEGDVVKYYNTEVETEGVGEVRWNDFFSAWHIGEYVVLIRSYLRLYEVIGNIHDNPELPEGDK